MARTYSSTPVLSKIKIGDSNYYLKDADARAILDSINDEAYAALQLGMGTVSGNDGKLVTAANIKAYVDAAVAVGLEIVVVQELPTASADTMGKLYLVPDAHATGDVYDEFITVHTLDLKGDHYNWEKIGNTDIDLSGYVTDIKFENGVLAQQKGNGEYDSVHEFGAMADADTASGTISDFVLGVSSAKVTAAGTVSKPDIDVTPTSGTIEVIDSVGTLPTKAADTFNAAEIQEGFFTAGTAASFAEGQFTPNTPTALDLTKFSGGSKAEDTFSAGSLPSKAADQFSAGTLPSLGAASTGTFAKAGLVAEVGTGEDAETLILTAAATDNAVTAQGAFSQGSLPSFTEGAFDAGALPSFTEGAFTPAALASGFYTAGTAASKAADSFTANTPAAVDVSKFDGGSFQEGAFTQGTLPTKKNQSVLASVAAELHEAPAFTGSEVDATVTLSKGTNSVTVTPNEREHPEE